MVAQVHAAHIAEGWDIRPTIAVTRAHINMPEIREAMAAGRLVADGAVLGAGGDARVAKIAIEPVWWLPGIARRFGVQPGELKRVLFEQTGGMFPELVTRPDLDVFLPPIGGTTIYLLGDVARLGRPETRITCRIHDECNGSDVFGSDICTCRPYLAHGIEMCIARAQQDGVGVIVYGRKEGRALGEVTKFLVYNARKRQEGGDRAERYFERTECVAGVTDMRFQELMPDALHWLGISRIDELVSMSNLKYQPLVASGIEVVTRVPIPEELIPPDASVEMDAKKAAGYFSTSVPTAAELAQVKGRGLEA
jgi:GTP cyclohydrolase II